MADPDRDRDPSDPDGPPASVGPEDDSTASAYAPPPRRQGFWRNPSMVAVVGIVVVALIVLVLVLLLG